MIVEIKVPSPGESISEVEIASWLVSDGDYVEKDQEIAEVESDKATLPLIAEEAGTIKIIAGTAESIKVGKVVCTIDTSAKAPDAVKTAKSTESTAKIKEGTARTTEHTASSTEPTRNEENTAEASGKAAGPDDKGNGKVPASSGGGTEEASVGHVRISPVAARMMEENNLSVEDVIAGLKRIGKNEVEEVIGDKFRAPLDTSPEKLSRDETRQRMSSLRRKLAERLVAVKNETAMLTTFNECDMSRVMELRKKHQQAFVEKHGVKLGFMSFFVKAVTVALRAFPNVNSRIEGEDMVTPGYCDVGIAVQTQKGLMVPVIRNAESLSLAGIESVIIELANKARAARISLDEMTGGSFTITNGGIFGSMLSTPLINPPQSAILGMHNIQERPVAVDGEAVIRPMMYIALSYDHRLIDGKDSVSFLVRVKELIENPVQMMFGGKNPDKILLDL